MNTGYEAVILTAGQSSRMGGFPKALLPHPGGGTFISRIIESFKAIIPPPEKITAVTGHHREKVEETLKGTDVLSVVNKNPDRGMLSSLLTGLDACNKGITGIMMIPVDHGLVNPRTYQAIIDEALKNPGFIIIPEYNERGGHPVFFPQEIFKDLYQSPPEEGARWAIRRNRHRTVRLKVDDQGIRADIDNPELYAEATGLKVNN